MGGEIGKLMYRLYQAVTYGLSPLVFVHLQWRRLRGLEHRVRWRERFGCSSFPRPPGPLIWFHAVSLGEGMAVIPVIKFCLLMRPEITILMTTTTTSAFEVIQRLLPRGVIYQFVPVDTPTAVQAFLSHWKPSALILMESELWPNLIFSVSSKGIPMALINGRMSVKSFNHWSGAFSLPLVSLMLSKFSLIAPLSTNEAIHFQLLEAPPFVINFAGDLKYAVGDGDISQELWIKFGDLQEQLAYRAVWMASSIHKGEEEGCTEGGLNVAVRSRSEKLLPSTNFYLVDTLGELRSLYRITPVAVICGSFLSSLKGHNISEAAAAGCAVITGPYVGHFSDMVLKMQRTNPLSVLQVSGKVELAAKISELLSDTKILEARQKAARQAFEILSNGVVENVWNLINNHVFKRMV